MYRFASFQLDPRAHELRRDGVRVKIPEQCYVVLSKLLERPGELITREELRKSVWPTDTFVDFDTSLNKIVKQLRQILGDSAESPSFIETVPKLGYRFISSLQAFEATTPIKNPAGVRSSESRPKSKRIVAIALVAAAMAATLLLLAHKRTTIPSSVAETVPLISLPWQQQTPSFSPDGNQVAFAVFNAGPASGIYTALIGGEKPLQLTDSQGDCCPVWSPDGRSVAFARESRKEFSIFVAPALGGTLRKLYSFNDERVENVVGDSRQISWSPDGKSLALSAKPPSSPAPSIALLTLADPSLRFLSAPPSGYSDWSPSFSPDGRLLVFRRTSGPGLVDDLYVMPASGGEPQRITTDNVFIVSQPAWTPDSREVVFASGRGGLTTLWRVEVNGSAPHRIEGIGASAFDPTVARKGERLAYVNGFANHKLWAVSLSDKIRADGSARAIVSSRGWNGISGFSPDSEKIAFESSRSGYDEIWESNRDGSNQTQLTFLNGEAGTPRWSYDGRRVAFDYRPKEHSEIFIADLSGGSPHELVTNPGADNFVPSWSRDGKWIFFASSRTTNAPQIWKISYPTGTPVQLTIGGGTGPIESADGFIYFSRAMGSDEIWKISSDGGKETLVMKGNGLTCWCNWALGHAGIYFIADFPDHKSAISFFEFDSHEVRKVLELADKARNLSLSPDGKLIVFSKLDVADQRILVVNHFR